jgi:hypothetical protein
MPRHIKPHPEHPVARWGRAFVEGGNFASAKYHIEVITDPWRYRPPPSPAQTMTGAFFHGNKIGCICADGTIILSARGWGGSPTTRSRLNALCEALGIPERFAMRQYQLWFGDMAVRDYEWIPALGPLGRLALAAERDAIKRAA